MLVGDVKEKIGVKNFFPGVPVFFGFIKQGVRTGVRSMGLPLRWPASDRKGRPDQALTSMRHRQGNLPQTSRPWVSGAVPEDAGFGFIAASLDLPVYAAACAGSAAFAACLPEGKFAIFRFS